MENQIAEKAIGIFDSGIGGLTVMRELKKELPHEKIIYLGDTARVPYGTRSSQTVIKYAIANIDFLLKHNIKLLVIACNTASAVATEYLREKYALPIVEVITPGASAAANTTQNKRVGVIGTEGTITSGAYQKAINGINVHIEVFTKACPLFVPLAEQGWCDPSDDIVVLIAKRYLEPLKHCDIDTLVLGCTHYPLLREAIQVVMGSTVRLIDSAETTAREVSKLLAENKLENKKTTFGIKHSVFVTDIPHQFKKMCKRFLGEKIESLELVDIS